MSSSSSVPTARAQPASPASSRKAPRASASSSAASSRPRADPFYGHEETAVLCARFVTALFQCPNIPTATQPGAPTPTLAHFVAYALHRTRLPSVVTFAALLLLQRLKTRFPAARGSSGHRLFISAFMLASKIICDDTYSNQSWCIVGQKMFALKEINQMEREMCGYLEWNLNVEGEDIAKFEATIRAEHGARAITHASVNVVAAVPTPPQSFDQQSATVTVVPAPAHVTTVYPSPEATPEVHQSSRPIRPVPSPYRMRQPAPVTVAAHAPIVTVPVAAGNYSFPSPAVSPRPYIHHDSPEVPAFASASSSLASSPASEDCKTPSPEPAMPSRSHSSKESGFEHARHYANMHLGGQPLSVGAW